MEVGRYETVFDPLTVAGTRRRDDSVARLSSIARFGYEANAGGTSYLNDPIAMLGSYQAGAPTLTVTAERSEPGAVGTVKWDDEGVAPDAFTLVKNGVLADFQTTRESARWLEAAYTKHGIPMRSHGCAAAPSAVFAQLQHTPNLTLAPGRDAKDFDALVSGMARGDRRQERLCRSGLPALERTWDGTPLRGETGQARGATGRWLSLSRNGPLEIAPGTRRRGRAAPLRAERDEGRAGAEVLPQRDSARRHGEGPDDHRSAEESMKARTTSGGSTMERRAEPKRLLAAEDRILTKDVCEAIARRVFALARGGGETFVQIGSWTRGELRWARNRVSLASDRRDVEIGIRRLIPSAGEGEVTTNQFDDESLEAAVRAAERMAASTHAPVRPTPGLPPSLRVPAEDGDLERLDLHDVRRHAWRDRPFADRSRRGEGVSLGRVSRDARGDVHARELRASGGSVRSCRRAVRPVDAGAVLDDRARPAGRRLRLGRPFELRLAEH